MGFAKKREKIEDGTPTLVGKNSSFEGNFSGNDSICIDGVFKGYIDCKGNVFINKDAVVEGDIKGKNIIVHGRVQGNIIAKEEIIIGQKGKVIGDISTKIFTVETGGILHGKCQMNGGQEEAKNACSILDRFSMFGGKKHRTIREKLDVLEKDMVGNCGAESPSTINFEEDDDVIEVVDGDDKKKD